jgi:Zn-dependent membrane protease YugP
VVARTGRGLESVARVRAADLARGARHAHAHRLSGRRGAIEEPHPTTALAWLRGVIAHLGVPGIHVVALDSGDARASDRNFYAPDANAVVLSPAVLEGADTRAHAIAAHELGHALATWDHPRWHRADRLARRWSWELFALGAGLVIATALVGGTTVRWLGLGLILLGFVAGLWVLASEVLASVIGYRLLRSHLGRPPKGAAATLVSAAVTYLSQPLAMIVVAVTFAWWSPWLGDGVLTASAAPIGRWWHGPLAVAMLAASCLSVLGIAWYGVSRRGLGAFVIIVAAALGAVVILIAPFFVVSVAGHPALPAWVFALAFAAAWERFVAIAISALRWLTAHLRTLQPLLAQPPAAVARWPRAALIGDLGLGPFVPTIVRIAMLAPIGAWWLFAR